VGYNNHISYQKDRNNRRKGKKQKEKKIEKGRGNDYGTGKIQDAKRVSGWIGQLSHR
jgi:hypothetical protein